MHFFVRPAWATTSRWGRREAQLKSDAEVDNDQPLVKGKGVYREVGSEGSRRQNLGLMNKNHIRGHMHWTSLQNKMKSKSYPEVHVVYVAGRREESSCSYPGRSDRNVRRNRVRKKRAVKHPRSHKIQKSGTAYNPHSDVWLNGQKSADVIVGEIK